MISTVYDWTGRRHSAETRAKMSRAQSGRVITPRHRSKLRRANLGKKASVETRRKISVASKRMHTPEFRLEASRLRKGVPKSEQHRRRIAAALKGKTKTAEHRRKLSASRKGQPSYQRTAATREKLSKSIIRLREAKPGPFANTSIELAVRAELERRGLTFVAQARIGRYLVDFLLPGRKLVIECDGCYWHCCATCNEHSSDASLVARVRAKDAERTRQLRAAGYTVARLTEHEIVADVRGSVGGTLI